MPRIRLMTADGSHPGGKPRSARRRSLCRCTRSRTVGYRTHMARKLKFDRLLFLTTLVLVAASIVMVYSASNVMAGENGQPNAF